MKVAACDVRLGDLIDLERDRYADPDGDDPHFPYEYAEVCHVERETPECVAIGFEGLDVYGFPTGYELNVVRRARQS